MNSISNNPHLKRQKKLQDKWKNEDVRLPRPKKEPRRRLRVLDVLNSPQNEEDEDA